MRESSTMDESQNIPLLAEDLSHMEIRKKQLVELPTIGVVGTGNFAIALTTRLVSSGYRVVIGSRKPSIRRGNLATRGNCLCGTEFTSIRNCLRRCEIIIIAIHMENFKDSLQPHSDLTRGKILVDVSNREGRYVSRSNAEYLSSLLPKAEVVKTFNTLSAYQIENNMNISSTLSGGQKVYVAGDDKIVRNKVLDFARSLGFQAVDYGGLKNAIDLENFVLKVFPGWKIPIFLAFGIFNLWSLYIVYIYWVESRAYRWEQVFLKVLNKPLCMTAITMLALTYLPGQIASVLQVWRGTKHSKFPRILDTWLKSRKQFGLIAFALVAFHVIASTLMLSPTYYKSWFHHPTITIMPEYVNNTLTLTSESGSASTSGSSIEIPISSTSSWMVWKGELALLFGIIAFLAMSVQAVTSIQAVNAVLNWSEWTCVQANLGTFVLLVSSCHVISMGAPGWMLIGPIKTLGAITFLCLILPILVLFMKFLFRWTPLYCYVKKIRRGWERGDRSPSNNSNEMESRTGKLGDLSSTTNNVFMSVDVLGSNSSSGSSSNNDNSQRRSCCVETNKRFEDTVVQLDSAVGEEDGEGENKKIKKKNCCDGGRGDSATFSGHSRSGTRCGCNAQFDRSGSDPGALLDIKRDPCDCFDDNFVDNRHANNRSKNKTNVRFSVDNTSCQCSSV